MDGGMTRFREHLLPAGDQLVVAPSMDDVHDRLQEISRRTGLDTSRFATTYMVTTPLPLYGLPDEPAPRWLGANASEIWSPIFWIPDEVARRWPIVDEDAEDGMRVEDTDEWALRIATHLALAGLYDPDTGYFLDVPEALGYDLQDPAVLQRFQDWLDGNPDEELEAIDPSPLWESDVSENAALDAYQAVRATYIGLFALSRFIGFTQVLDFIDNLILDEDMDPAELKQNCAYAVTLARLLALPMDDPALDLVLGEAEANVEVSETRDELLGFALRDMTEALQNQLEVFRPDAEEAANEGLEALDSTGIDPDDGDGPDYEYEAAAPPAAQA